MRSLIQNKRGDINSLIIVLIVVLFVIGIVSIFFSKFYDQLNTEIQASTEFSDNAKAVVDNVNSKTIPFLDYLFLFSFISILIGLIISAIYIDTNPALAVVFIIVTIIAIILAGVFANAFVEIGEDSELSTTYDQFTFTKAIINHFPLMIFISALIVGIVLYAKPKGGSSYGM